MFPRAFPADLLSLFEKTFFSARPVSTVTLAQALRLEHKGDVSLDECFVGGYGFDPKVPFPAPRSLTRPMAPMQSQWLQSVPSPQSASWEVMAS